MLGEEYSSKGALNRKEFQPINGELLLVWRFILNLLSPGIPTQILQTNLRIY